MSHQALFGWLPALPWLAELDQPAAGQNQGALKAVAAAQAPAEALPALGTTALPSATALALEASALDVAVPDWTDAAWQPLEMREPSPEAAAATDRLIHIVLCSNKVCAASGSQCT